MTFSFLVLSPEILNLIISFLTFNSVISLSYVNKKFQGLILYPPSERRKIVCSPLDFLSNGRSTPDLNTSTNSGALRNKQKKAAALKAKIMSGKPRRFNPSSPNSQFLSPSPKSRSPSISPRSPSKKVHESSIFRLIFFNYLREWTGCREVMENSPEDRSRGLEWRLACLMLVDRYEIARSRGESQSSAADDQWAPAMGVKDPEESSKRWVGPRGDRFVVELCGMWHFAIALSLRGCFEQAINKYNKCLHLTKTQKKLNWNGLEKQRYHDRMATLCVGKCACYWRLVQQEHQRQTKYSSQSNSKQSSPTYEAFISTTEMCIKHFRILFEDKYLSNVREYYRIVLIGLHVRLASFFSHIQLNCDESLRAFENALTLCTESQLDLVLYQVHLRMQVAQVLSVQAQRFREALETFDELLQDFVQDLSAEWVNHLLMCITLCEIMYQLSKDDRVLKDNAIWNRVCRHLSDFVHRFGDTTSEGFRTSWQLDFLEGFIDAIHEVEISNVDYAVDYHFVQKEQSSKSARFASDLWWIREAISWIRQRVEIASKNNLRYESEDED